MGREAAIGQFRLGRESGETPLRVARTDGKAFHEGPIYDAIRGSLNRFGEKLTGNAAARFLNPFLTPAADALASKSISLSHPLGGCRMAASAGEGVVDEYGRLFDTTKVGDQPYYPGLYIADAAIIPTALGVNPSLTISALALRIAAKVIEELAASEKAAVQ